MMKLLIAYIGCLALLIGCNSFNYSTIYPTQEKRFKEFEKRNSMTVEEARKIAFSSSGRKGQLVVILNDEFFFPSSMPKPDLNLSGYYVNPKTKGVWR